LNIITEKIALRPMNELFGKSLAMVTTKELEYYNRKDCIDIN
jgi:hypothetical protein